MNVLIFPTDDRSGQTNLIYHYAKLGHKVFIPKHGTFGLNWKRIATWPGLLCKASSDPLKRNIEIHGFVRNDDNIFGEDFFLKDVNWGETPHSYIDNITCELIDESFDEKIDVFHTLRGGEAYLNQYFEIAKVHFPSAKWVSSTFNQMSSKPGNFVPKNAAKLIPAPYENHHLDTNNVNLMSTDFEARLLGVNLANCHLVNRFGFASFNHNFAERQPNDFRLFTKMNEILNQKNFNSVANFGGNIRTQGADVRFSGQNGITGNFPTLTPLQAYALTSTLSGVVHFKADDWGGGVFYYSMNSSTPIITTQRYIDASNSSKFLVHMQNCIVVKTPEEAAEAVISLTTNQELVKTLSAGMQKIKDEFFSPDYWKVWESFLGALV